MKRHHQPFLKPAGAHSWPVPEYLLPPEWSELRVASELQTAAEAARATDRGRSGGQRQMSPAA